MDPSLSATGVAAVDGSTRTVGGAAKDGDRRLDVIYRAVRSDCAAADFVLIEDLPAHAQAAGLTGLAAGVTRLALQHQGTPYLAVPPATLKKFATGKGNATKADMRMALYTRTSVDLRDDNQVDAAWLRYLALDVAGLPVVQVPQAHRGAGYLALAAQAISVLDRVVL